MAVLTRLFSRASAECSSFDLKQFWHFALLKIFASNLRHLLSIITIHTSASKHNFHLFKKY